MIIRVQNNLDQNATFTYLSNGEAVGASSLRVKNINGFNASWAVQIGKSGEEQSEVKILGTATPSGTALSLTGTANYAHATDIPVYAIKFDQIVFERSTAGTAGTATPMTNGTITITADAPFTQFDDTSGAATYAYRTYFKNSVTNETSSESDWLTPSGFTFYSLAKIRDRVKRKLFSSGYIKDDLTISDWINEWLEKMTNVAIDVNKDYVLGTANVGFSGTAETGTITAVDFKEVRRVWMTSNGSDYYAARKMDLIGYIPQQTFVESYPYYYMKGDNVIGRKPADTSGTAVIDYYKISSVLSNDTDELPVVMHAYSKSFVDYALGQAYFLDGKAEFGGRFDNAANAELEKFRAEITPRSKSGPTGITITDPIDADDGWSLIN